MQSPPLCQMAITTEHLSGFISEKLLEELTGGDSHVLQRCLACAQAKQRALYHGLGITCRNEPVDEEICLLIAVAWLYQYNGDYETDALYYKKACLLIENSYAIARKQAGRTGIAAICPGLPRIRV